MITREIFERVVSLRKEGYTYREIHKKLGVPLSEISAIVGAHAIVEEERRALEGEKESIRKDVEEIKAKRRKVEELKRKESEMQKKVAEATNDLTSIKSEYTVVKEEFKAVKEEEKEVKKVIGRAADYQKRKEKLESDYDMLRNKLKADLARYEVIRGELEIMKEEYDKIREGIKDKLIPTFLKLNIEDKVDFFLYLPPDEFSSILNFIIRKKMTDEIARNLLS